MVSVSESGGRVLHVLKKAGATGSARALLAGTARPATGIASGTLRRMTLPAALVLAMLPACEAAAHQLNVFATVEGTTIRGEAYYRGKVPACQAKVEVFDPAGTRLGQSVTDDQGRFTFQAKVRCDHRLVVDGGQGHSSEFTVQAAELPASLPAAASGPGSVTPSPAEGNATTPAAAAMPGVSSPAASGTATASPTPDLTALQAQIGQLRRELDAWQHQTQFRDILGGIGFILGLAGIAFYFLGVRRQERAGAVQPPDNRKA